MNAAKPIVWLDRAANGSIDNIVLSERMANEFRQTGHKLEPLYASASVAVKSLEWSGPNILEDGQSVWAAIAEGMEFTYSIWSADGRFFCAKVLPQHFDSLEEAKEAVQINYNDRIRLALVDAPDAVAIQAENKKLRGDIRSYEITMQRIQELDAAPAFDVVAALKLAANRLARCVVDHAPNSREFLERSEWADEARVAVSKAEARL